MVSGRTPTVFVSSTCYDLKQIREDIRDFFQNSYGLEVMLSEFDSFPVDPCIGTFENCLKNVDECADIFVLIVGTRYGYVTDKGKSITNLEYLHAKAKGIPIYVFVSKQLYNSLPLWRKNKDSDFSGIVDNTQIFDFVDEIYNECRQWIYTYDSVRDITATLKNQLLLVFSDGLKYKKLLIEPQFALLDGNIPSDAARVLIEQPYAWEYKFLVCVLKNEFVNLKSRRWDYKYGLYEGGSLALDQISFVDTLSEKLNDILKLIDCLDTLINTVIQDALGEPGTPSDLELMIYVSKQIASVYDRMVHWALYFKSLHLDEKYSHLIDLLYELPASALNSIDTFVNDVYTEISNLPDVYDGEEKDLKLTCKLEAPNTDEINAEMQRVFSQQ